MAKTTEIMEAISLRFIEAFEEVLEDPTKRLPWQKKWSSSPGGFPINPTTGNLYNGVNVLLLWMQGYSDPRWMGFGQAKSKGWSVKKGSKGTKIYRPKMVKDRETGEGKCIGYALSTVFNGSQIEGIPSLDTNEVPVVDPMVGYAKAAKIYEAWPVPSQRGGDRAFYAPTLDMIQVPEPGRFESLDDFWSTCLHEIIHSTGHKDRLDRISGHSYAMEELVAEIGSSFMCAHVGIDSPTLTENHHRYVHNWIASLKDDPAAINSAARMAQNAAEYIIKTVGV